MLTDLRHSLHQHPGLSGNEFFAHDLIVDFLGRYCNADKLYDHVGGYGVIAVWGSRPAAPTVAFRADIDALPIGHRCGHDGHTAILLRLAQLLSEHRAQLLERSNVILIFQPEEETGQGSQKILDSGILQQYNILRIYALHNIPGYPEGEVLLNRHTFAAASSGVIYRLEGRPTHASTPEKGLNPGIAVAEIIQHFSRFNSNPATTTSRAFTQSTLICARVGEEAFGTSAGMAEVMFTLRAFTNDNMERLLHEAETVAHQAAERHHLQFSSALVDPFRATENNSLLVEDLERRLCNIPCRYHYLLEPFRWSEDFANYLTLFPGVLFGIGAGEKHPELHHPDYDFPDGLIEPAAQIFYSLI